MFGPKNNHTQLQPPLHRGSENDYDAGADLVVLHCVILGLDICSRYFLNLHCRLGDNGSTDATPDIGRRLAEEDPRVAYLRIEQRGRGRALDRAWRESGADVVGYMDVDLSTGLDALPALVDAVRSGRCGVAVGSRLRPGSRVIGRSLLRELTSRGYSALFRLMFLTGFRDAQCGFKAASRRVVDAVVPLVRDRGWFFDTEMLILAEKNGYRVEEIPVTWTDDPDSRVRIVATAWADLKGLLRLRFGGLRRASKALRSP